MGARALVNISNITTIWHGGLLYSLEVLRKEKKSILTVHRTIKSLLAGQRSTCNIFFSLFSLKGYKLSKNLIAPSQCSKKVYADINTILQTRQ